MGGRQFRNGIDNGEIYDHFCVEYTYKDGTKLHSECRHIPNCWSSVSEHAHGTKGYSDVGGGYFKSGRWRPTGATAPRARTSIRISRSTTTFSTTSATTRSRTKPSTARPAR